MHSGDTAGTQPPFQRQVEIRGVNADEHCWRIGSQALIELVADSEQFREMAQHFDQPHDRQPLHGHHTRKPLGQHFRTTDTGETGVGIAGLEGSDETGTEQITRQFARNDSNLHRRRSSSGRSRCGRALPENRQEFAVAGTLPSSPALSR